MKQATKAIHAGNEPEKVTGAVMPPIYMTSTFVQDVPGESRDGYEYTRASNPNFTILEEALASLENAQYATIFSSGLGALSGLITGLLSSGNKVVAINGLYGGTYRLFTKVFNRFGIQFKSIPFKNEKELAAELSSKPSWLLFETPTNPLLGVFDIELMTRVAKQHGVLTIVDNTFATPCFQNPLDLGADVVWHSTTKYIGGHSDVIGGVMMTNNLQIKESLDFARKAVGLNPSPFDAWLTNRGVKTLPIRMKQHEHNAMQVAKYLSKHSKVKKIYYPGLEADANYELAKKQMKGFGGMVSAEFMLSLEETKKLIASFKLFTLAESLGGVESLVCHPATMTHASIPPEERARIGLSDGLVRFSVGIEDPDDLIKDLTHALG